MVQTGSSSKGDSWQVHHDTTAVAAALDSKGLCEGALKRGIAAAFPGSHCCQLSLPCGFT